MNSKFNPAQKQIILVTDGPQKKHSEVLISLQDRLRESGFEPKPTILEVPSEIIVKSSESYHKFDRVEFERSYSTLEKPIDLELLMDYANKANPSFSERIKQEVVSGSADIKEFLWKEYCFHFTGNAVHPISLDLSIPTAIRKKNGPTHLLYVLFEHQLTSPRFIVFGELAYHMVGRGFSALGTTGKIRTSDAQDERLIVVNMKALGNVSVEDKIIYAREILNHEWEGHAIRGLKDHFGQNRDRNCIMHTKPTAEEYLQTGKKLNGRLYFCESCTTESISLNKQI